MAENQKVQSAMRKNNICMWFPSFLQIFRYADHVDKLLMVLGCIGAIGDGMSTPLMILIMSSLVNVFGQGSDSATFSSQVSKFTLYFTYVAVGVLVACLLEASCWMRTGERQASRMRFMYLRGMLRQDVAYFDAQDNRTSQVITSVAVDTLTIQETLSEKVPHFILNISTFVSSYVIAFYLAWELAVVAMAFLPLLIIPGLMYGKILKGLAAQMQVEYVKAGVVAEQAISSIRTVFSFVGEQRTMARFSMALEGTLKLGLKQGLAKGFAVGSNGILFAIWAFMAWYGSHLIMHEGLKGGQVISTGICILLGGLGFGMAIPDLKYIEDAKMAACRISEMIQRVPAIDSEDKSGKVLSQVSGEIELRNVNFSYASRPSCIVLKGLSLTIPASKTVALVGSSGSGKSTVISLLERFYDPLSGEILLDGIDIRDLQLKWLRSQMGLVSQEPILFAMSIKDNILVGKEDASWDEIKEAANQANVHNFVSRLPNGYDTKVGERGVQMSGGQKQRIAIARALLKDPPILLLDEATSALDGESERAVQEAIDFASVGKTTVIVAHRLSTIRNADVIVVMQSGQVVEQGQHEELSSREGGAYASLVKLQQLQSMELETTSVNNNREEKVLDMAEPLLRFSSSPSHRLSRCSEAGEEAEEKEEEASYSDKGEPKPPSFHRLLAMNRPEWKQGLMGSIGAVGFGIVQPLYAFTFGSMLSAFFLEDHDEEKRKIKKFCVLFLALAVGSFVTNLLQHYYFASMGEHLTKRIRETIFAKILSFELGWFDQDHNNTGTICARLATEANVVRSLVGDRIALIIQTVSATIAACAFGLAIAWKLAIVMIAVQPLVILCFYTRTVILRNSSSKALTSQDKLSQLAAEAIGNHRTVTAFSSQTKIMDLFQALQVESHEDTVKQSWVAGAGLGVAQFTMFCTWALNFWYGGKLISGGHLSYGDFFITFFVLLSTGRVIADAGSMTSDIAKGHSAVASLFSILDRTGKINPNHDKQATPEKVLEGNVDICDVDFSYPARPEVMILRGFNLSVKAGKSVALVGHSGSGKSTVIALIERFYEPLKGKVLIDGKDIKSLHLQSLRKHISLVSQEPTLFAGTIRDNILYGSDDNATETEMIDAAKAANAHDFICSLSQGYETGVGGGGSQLSGGQKQRIAIARAILKKPAILLLDEATSALDSQAEKVVQEAVERIMLGRTTLVVAHRFSAIQTCHSIAVIHNGTVVEHGSHANLLSNQTGAYFNLFNFQNKTTNKPPQPS